MPRKRTVEPIGPATIPGEPLDPKIPPTLSSENDDDFEESEGERQARESEAAFDQARTRTPPG